MINIHDAIKAGMEAAAEYAAEHGIVCLEEMDIAAIAAKLPKAQQPEQALTDEEIMHVFNTCGDDNHGPFTLCFARAIEAKLKC